MNLNPDGTATLCCQSHVKIYDEQGRSLNAQTHSLEEIWNSEAMKDIRKRMTNGEYLPHCAECFRVERFRKESYRLRSNRQWLVERSKAADIAKAIECGNDGATFYNPMYFDLKLGNLCNLKCTCCKPLYSSMIERDEVHYGWASNAPYYRLPNRFGTEDDWWASAGLLREIIGMAGDLSLIQLVGGEPTINKTQIALLKFLCDSGQASEIDLILVTNLTTCREEIYQIFTQFRSLKVFLSIDGCNDTYEYVRYPGKWDTLVANIQRLRKALPGTEIVINVVLQAINAMNVADLFAWADESRIPIILDIGRGLEQYNDFRILPAHLRAEVRRRFDEYCSRQVGKDKLLIKQNIKSVFDEMEETDFSEDIRPSLVHNLMEFINDMDKSRGLSFKSVAPDIYKYLVEYNGGWDEATRYA